MAKPPLTKPLLAGAPSPPVPAAGGSRSCLRCAKLSSSTPFTRSTCNNNMCA